MKRWLGIAALVLTLLLGWALFVHRPSGPRSLAVFDPDRIADLEVDMWKAYYRKERARLGGLLVLTLREQYQMT